MSGSLGVRVWGQGSKVLYKVKVALDHIRVQAESEVQKPVMLSGILCVYAYVVGWVFFFFLMKFQILTGICDPQKVRKLLLRMVMWAMLAITEE